MVDGADQVILAAPDPVTLAKTDVGADGAPRGVAVPDSKVIPVGALSPVLLPEMVLIGAVFPVAPEAYSVMELLFSLATQILPDESTFRAMGASSAVLVPEIVLIGATSPDEPEAYSKMDSLL